MKRKLLCLVCSIIMLISMIAGAQATVAKESVSNIPTTPETPAPVLMISNTEDYALSLLGYGIGYATHSEADTSEDGDTLLGTYIQVGFVDKNTMTSVTAEQVIAAEKSARLSVVPIVYTTTLSATNNNYIRWSVNIEALDRSVKIKSVDVTLTYVDLSDMRPTWSEDFTMRAFIANHVLNATSRSQYAFPSGSETSVGWRYELEVGNDGAYAEPESGSDRVVMP